MGVQNVIFQVSSRDELVQAVLDYLRAQESDVMSAAEAIIKDIWAKISHTEMAMELAACGLAKYTHDALHARHHLGIFSRYEPVSVEISKTKTESRRAISDVDVVLSSVFYSGKDNTIRPVIDFDVEDCLAAKENARRKAEGYQRLARWFDSAAKSLRKHKARLIRFLPKEEKHKLIMAYYTLTKEVIP